MYWKECAGCKEAKKRTEEMKKRCDGILETSSLQPGIHTVKHEARAEPSVMEKKREPPQDLEASPESTDSKKPKKMQDDDDVMEVLKDITLVMKQQEEEERVSHILICILPNLAAILTYVDVSGVFA